MDRIGFYSKDRFKLPQQTHYYPQLQFHIEATLEKCAKLPDTESFLLMGGSRDGFSSLWTNQHTHLKDQLLGTRTLGGNVGCICP